LRINTKYIAYEAILLALLAIGVYYFYSYYSNYISGNPFREYQGLSNSTILHGNYSASQYSCTSAYSANVSKVCTQVFNLTANTTKLPVRIVIAYYLFNNRQSLHNFMSNILNNSFLSVGNITYENYTMTYTLAQFVNGYKVFTAYVPNGASIFEIAALDNRTNDNFTIAKSIIGTIGFRIQGSFKA